MHEFLIFANPVLCCVSPQIGRMKPSPDSLSLSGTVLSGEKELKQELQKTLRQGSEALQEQRSRNAVHLYEQALALLGKNSIKVLLYANNQSYYIVLPVIHIIGYQSHLSSG